jgi:methyl-accepting chemotaxis protein
MDVERTIEFLLKQQAQLTSTVNELAGTVSKLTSSVERNQVQIDSIAGAIHVLIKVSEENRQAVQRVDQKSEETRDNLNALIKIVDDLVRRRDNGRVQ